MGRPGTFTDGQYGDAEERSALPASIASETLTVMGVALVVHVLEDGQRIIETDGFHALIEAMAAGPMTAADADTLTRAIKGPPHGS